MLDYNWFFSSVAQSAAAIVGIFSAFITSKILNNQNDYKNNLKKLKNYKNKMAYYIGKTKNRYFSWYNEKIREKEIEEICKDLNLIIEEGTLYTETKIPEYIDDKEITRDLIEKLYYEKDFSIYDSRDTIESEIIKHLTGEKTISKNPLTIDSRLFQNQRNELEEEEEKISELRDEILHFMREIKVFKEEIEGNPESSVLIGNSIVMVSILFLVGVIYPLSFLPLEKLEISFKIENILRNIFCFKGILLTIISSIFLVILVIFHTVNRKMKYSKEEIEVFNKYSDIRNYSVYFKNMVENKEFFENYENKEELKRVEES